MSAHGFTLASGACARFLAAGASARVQTVAAVLLPRAGDGDAAPGAAVLKTAAAFVEKHGTSARMIRA